MKQGPASWWKTNLRSNRQLAQKMSTFRSSELSLAWLTQDSTLLLVQKSKVRPDKYKGYITNSNFREKEWGTLNNQIHFLKNENPWPLLRKFSYLRSDKTHVVLHSDNNTTRQGKITVLKENRRHTGLNGHLIFICF